jgi:hypothetical protein
VTLDGCQKPVLTCEDNTHVCLNYQGEHEIYP